MISPLLVVFRNAVILLTIVSPFALHEITFVVPVLSVHLTDICFKACF
jgi:hypothetical protein